MSRKRRNIQFVSSFIPNMFDRWLERRIPIAETVTLNQKKIFIFPSKSGFSFLLVLLLVLLLAINFENSMIFAITFLLVSMFVASILYTFNNLSGLTISAVGAKPCFASEHAEFTVMLSGYHKKDYENIIFKWDGTAPVVGDLIEETLELLETHGGEDAFINIKYMIP